MPKIVRHKKYAGMLLPVFAMRHATDLGIGDTLAVKETIEFCARNALGILQLLPIHETIGDHSPYNAISSRALSPALLALSEDQVPGLDRGMVAEAASESWLGELRVGPVKYNSVLPLKLHILLAAHGAFNDLYPLNSDASLRREFERFKTKNASWLADYTLFRLLVREYEGNPNWEEWRPEHKSPAGAAAWLARHRDRPHLDELRDGFAYIQWIAWRQWREVKQHAGLHDVLLMGEMSFGVGRCSVDVWSGRALFDLEWSVGSRPIVYFDTNKDSERWGQNWGLPAYRWENHRADGFAWLRGRIGWEREFFHICRLDHLRGYFRMYTFPWSGGAQHTEFAKLTEEEARQRTGGRLPRFIPGSDDDSVSEKLNDVQGREIISVIQDAAGDMHLVAEIMGAMPDYMRRTLDDLALANLTFPQLERGPDRSLQPKTSFRALSLATYANHDHAPLAAFYLGMKEHARTDRDGIARIDLDNLLRFVGWTGPAPETMTSELLAAFQRTLLETPCQFAVFLSSDVFGTSQRFNLPGSYGAGTWCERLDYPLSEYEHHSDFGPRVALLAELIRQAGRTFPAPQSQPLPHHVLR